MLTGPKSVRPSVENLKKPQGFFVYEPIRMKLGMLMLLSKTQNL